jgi:hypothetical protein
MYRIDKTLRTALKTDYFAISNIEIEINKNNTSYEAIVDFDYSYCDGKPSRDFHQIVEKVLAGEAVEFRPSHCECESWNLTRVEEREREEEPEELFCHKCSFCGVERMITITSYDLLKGACCSHCNGPFTEYVPRLTDTQKRIISTTHFNAPDIHFYELKTKIEEFLTPTVDSYEHSRYDCMWTASFKYKEAEEQNKGKDVLTKYIVDNDMQYRCEVRLYLHYYMHETEVRYIVELHRSSGCSMCFHELYQRLKNHFGV